MFGRLMPKEVRYFDFFDAHAEQIVAGGQALVAMIGALIDSPEQAALHAAQIDQCERQADKITRETEAMLHTSFITPFDRDEIHQLITHMDNVLDQIENVAESMTLYDIHKVTLEAKRMADLSLSCCETVARVIKLLRSLANAPLILKACREIDQIEDEVDVIMREAMSRAFREEPDLRQLIKLKAIYEQLEAVTDCCKDVGNTVQGIVLENS